MQGQKGINICPMEKGNFYNHLIVCVVFNVKYLNLTNYLHLLIIL